MGWIAIEVDICLDVADKLRPIIGCNSSHFIVIRNYVRARALGSLGRANDHHLLLAREDSPD